MEKGSDNKLLTPDLCNECGRVIREKRVGTLTSWIFAATRCTCQDDDNLTASKKPTLVDRLVDKGAPRAVHEAFRDKYEILDYLGSGSVCSVYKVEHVHLKSVMALKVLEENLNDHEMFVQRFKREGQSLSKLSHPNLISFQDFGITSDGRAYLAMEFVEGYTLADAIALNERLPVSMAMDIFEQLVRGLIHAHEQGIIHRDIKPENIMVGVDDGTMAKLLDFGLVKVITEENNTLTKTGEVFGSPLYMSPEQCLGKKVGPQTDIYSLGIVLYEMISGECPISGASDAQIIENQVSQKPDSILQMKDWKNDSAIKDEDIDELIMKCIEKSPEDRYENFADILGRLTEIKDKSNADADISGDDLEYQNSDNKDEVSLANQKNKFIVPAAIVIISVLVVLGFYFIGAR